MNRLTSSILPILAALSFSLSVAAIAQATQKDLTGTWALTSNYNMRQDGTRFEPFGSNPKGILMFDAHGHFSAELMRADRAKFASNNRMQATSDENKATVQGTLAFFGTYSVNPSDHSFTLHFEGSSFPNWEGTDRKYILEDSAADELKYRSPPSSTGAAFAELVWKRVK